MMCRVLLAGLRGADRRTFPQQEILEAPGAYHRRWCWRRSGADMATGCVRRFIRRAAPGKGC
jgi:hypothetical protein